MSRSYRYARDIQAAPSQRRDITQSGNTATKTLLTFLAVVILAISAIGYGTVGRLGNQISASELSLGGGSGVKGNAPDGAIDILLVGSDSRTDAQGNPLSDEELARLNAGVSDGELNTDTLMVIRVPNDGSRATAVSIPRDTYVHDDDYGNLKINSVYANYAADRRAELLEDGAEENRKLEEKVATAGQQGLISAVADLTGIEVDHYAEVGLLGFVLLTDAIGGVDVCLNEDVDDEFSGAHFPAGVSTLDGTQALAFVRQRHGLPRGDLDRIVRQQAFMASLVQKVLSAGTLTNPAKLSDLGNAVQRSVTIDQNWDILAFASQLANLAGGNVTFTTIPVTSIDGTGDFGESIVTVDSKEVHTFMDELLNPPKPDPTPTEEKPAEEEDNTFEGYSVHVLNAGQISGQAGGVGAYLEENGLAVAEVTNAIEGVYSSSQVVAADPNDPAALKLAEMLGGLEVTANEGLDSATLIVVTADEYAGPKSNVSDEIDTPEEPVGTPGADFGEAEVAPEIDAGGDGPRCVN
ncbi:LCP family protein [Corynebacterium breve]|uniref:LCP family protein n=1 Tax=Corynebacterium breve TaxID=3049799 RepID=A0ABY8VL32_9CORY|nr:LCP family protein [Corynebacterium breve]WIM68255.1 LCP family protein [Corynebacterium breve]